MGNTRARASNVICVLLLLFAPPLFAGGVVVRTDTVSFVGPGPVVEPKEQVTVRFLANEYFYGGNEYAYLAWAVVPATASDKPSPQQLDRWVLHGVLAGVPQRDKALGEAAAPYLLTFAAPDKPGKYKVVLGGVPVFLRSPLESGTGYKQSFTPLAGDRRELSRAIGGYPGSLQRVATIEVTAGAASRDDTPTLYLRMNDNVPSAVKTPGGVQREPISFSWRVGPEFKGDVSKVRYRYRMDPDDDGKWGAWTTLREVHYPFLFKGVHQFSVQAQYAGKVMRESSPASYQFTLDRDHVSKPTKETFTKGLTGAPTTALPPIDFAALYPQSRALVVGMWHFEDAKSFPQFDAKKIAADVAAMEAALRKNGFEVTTLTKERVTRDDILEALSKLVDGAGRDDRLFVYFSTHGFPDPGLPSDGYLATSDCQYGNPTVKCLRLKDLQIQADRAIDGRQVRQILFAVDSCFAGLGIVRKSVGVPDLTRLAEPSGAFMLTAGMANQLAQIDPTLGMSTFTYYLAEGLKGNADILGNNGLITLSELFVYVQYKVAEQTKAQQIPMLGRMKGEGEMLFLPK